MEFEFYHLWGKLDFSAYGSAEDTLIEDLKKIGTYFIERREKMTKEGWKPASYLYNYEEIGKVVNHEMYGWCIINMLANANYIDWGTSLRNGWLTTEGERLFFHFIGKYSTEVLYEAIDGNSEIEEIIEMQNKGVI